MAEKDNVLEKDWITESGLRAVVLMVDDSHRCGYVAIPKSHPLFGVCDGDHTVIGGKWHNPLEEFIVHGGITYAANNGEYPVPSDQSSIWWFGYDCAHYGDATRYNQYLGGIRRTLDFCVQECESFARQLSSSLNNDVKYFDEDDDDYDDFYEDI